MDDIAIWKIINSYFEDNPQCLVSHHIDSYNDFFKNGIFQIFKEKNPITISSNLEINAIYISVVKMALKYILENPSFMMKKNHIICFQMKPDYAI
jgi:DNA-directed RNA polymerase beta subunit